jgi:hypothetical protein
VPPSPFCDYKGPPSPLAHDPHCVLPSTLFRHCSLPAPVTGWAAQSPGFSPRDVVGLTWSSLLILPLSRLTALIRLFLEPNFLDNGRTPKWVSTRSLANLVGRCLTLGTAPSPPSASLHGLLSCLSRFLPPQASRLAIVATRLASDDSFPRQLPR